VKGWRYPVDLDSPISLLDLSSTHLDVQFECPVKRTTLTYGQPDDTVRCIPDDTVLCVHPM
jgi:hypothetical protein